MLNNKEIEFRASYKFLSNENLPKVLDLDTSKQPTDNMKEFLLSLTTEEKKELLRDAKDEVLTYKTALKAVYEQIAEDTKQQGQTLFDWETIQTQVAFWISVASFLNDMGAFDRIRDKFKDKK
jgi:hypothetical protein